VVVVDEATQSSEVELLISPLYLPISPPYLPYISEVELLI